MPEPGHRRARTTRRQPDRPDRPEPPVGQRPPRGTSTHREGRGPSTKREVGSDMPATMPGRARLADPGRDTTSRIGNRLDKARAGAARFHVERELGRGGMGVVSAAEDQALRRHVAIKTLRHDGELQIVKFLDEAQITGQLQHPNIVPIYELGVDDHNRPFMVMKQIVGRTLTRTIDEAHDAVAERGEADRRVVLRQLVDHWLKACDAVAFAHSRGVLHRDLKPDNVMVGEYGEVLVVDWGLARLIGDSSPDQPVAGPSSTPGIAGDSSRVVSDRRETGTARTLEGTVTGTLPYMPPEQAAGMVSQLDEGADIYALGAILYQILTGSPPFRADNNEKLHAEVIQGSFESPSTRAPYALVPRELEAVVHKAMARRRRDRYETVGELQADVRNWLDGRTLSAADYTSWQLLGKWARRNKAAVIGAAASLLALIGGVVAVLMVMHSAELDRLQVEADAQRRQLEIRAEVDRQRTDAETERLAAEAKALRLEGERREIELREMMQRGQLQELRERLNVRLRFERNEAVLDFYSRYRKWRDSGRSWEEFFDSLDPHQVDGYIEAFKQVFRASDTYGQKLYDASDYFFLGVLYGFGKKQPDTAFWLFEQSLEMDHAYVEVFVNRGVLYMSMDQLDKAIDDFRKATELMPESMIVWNNLGAALKADGQTADALDAFDQAIRLDGNALQPRLARGDALRRMGRHDEAVQELNRAAVMYPRVGRVYYFRAMAHYSAGNHPAAIDDFSRAIGFDDTDAESYMRRGMAYRDAGKEREALADFTKSMELDPASNGPWVERGLLHAQAGRTNLAIADLETAAEMDAGDKLPWLNLGGVYLQLQDWAKAESYFDRAIELAPDDADTWFGRATARRMAGAYDQRLRDDLEKVVELDPDHWEALTQLGAIAGQDGRNQQAVQLLQRAYDLCPMPDYQQIIADLMRRFGGRPR